MFLFGKFYCRGGQTLLLAGHIQKIISTAGHKNLWRAAVWPPLFYWLETWSQNWLRRFELADRYSSSRSDEISLLANVEIWNKVNHRFSTWVSRKPVVPPILYLVPWKCVRWYYFKLIGSGQWLFMFRRFRELKKGKEILTWLYVYLNISASAVARFWAEWSCQASGWTLLKENCDMFWLKKNWYWTIKLYLF